MTASILMTDRWAPGRASAAPYDRSNLATHVGEDPAVVSANRLALRGELAGIPVVWLDQVHGREVRRVSAAEARAFSTSDRPAWATGDGVVTGDPDVALAVLVADCVPVLLADDEAGVIGVAHAGRRGVALGVVEATITEMAALGASPTRLKVTLGPAIGGCCYEVGAEVADEVIAVAPEAQAMSRNGRPALDLRAALAAQLRRRGVAGVDISTVCTAESPSLYSYRRDGTTGRFAGVIWRAS